jgi:hypothetical protein
MPFPGSRTKFIAKAGQVKQSQHGVIDFVFVNFHDALSR